MGITPELLMEGPDALHGSWGSHVFCFARQRPGQARGHAQRQGGRGPSRPHDWTLDGGVHFHLIPAEAKTFPASVRRVDFLCPDVSDQLLVRGIVCLLLTRRVLCTLWVLVLVGFMSDLFNSLKGVCPLMDT